MPLLAVQDVQRESLYEVFKHFGPIRSVQVKRSGDHCIAYCEFEDVGSAQAAIASQDTHFGGKRVSCAELQPGSWRLLCPAWALARSAHVQPGRPTGEHVLLPLPLSSLKHWARL